MNETDKAVTEWTGRTFHKIKGYPDFTIAFDYDDNLFHIFNNDQEIATCDTASDSKRIVKQGNRYAKLKQKYNPNKNT